MKQFTLKFIIVLIVFFIPVCYFRFIVIPNVSGDIGRLGLIRFGKEQEGLEVSWYLRDMDCAPGVIDICDPDSLRYYSLITIGDSFSQFNKDGYQQSLSNCLGHTVVNYRTPRGSGNPLESYLALLNNGYIENGKTVILESVERSFVKRFSQLDSLESYSLVPEMSVLNDDKDNTTFLYSFFSWVRQSVGYQTAIQHFPLSKDCFTHKRFSQTLFVYNGKLLGDGDLMWDNISNEEYDKADSNMKRMIELSTSKGINLIIMIACDKYDAYEPWISVDHEENPTLKSIPQENRLFVTRDYLRRSISIGTKDVYKLNDTHWSVVGADIVGCALYDWMKELGFIL